MGMKANQIIECSEEDIQIAISEVEASGLLNKKIIIHCLSSVINISALLQKKNISIERLLRALFDKKTEKLAEPLADQTIDNTSQESGHKNEPPSIDQSDDDKDKKEDRKKTKKGHGRKSFKAYTGAEVVVVNHTTLFEGDHCPLGCGAKVYKYEPGIYVRITGSPLFSATVYQTQKYRCNGCQAIFEAVLDQKIKEASKYDSKAIVNIALAKFELGIPYHRLEQYQDSFGIPVASSVQTDQIEVLSNNCYKIFHCLEDLAANSFALSFDDTKVPVLEYDKENKEATELNLKNFKKGYYASVIAAKIQQEYLEMTPAIVLVYLDRKHAAQNFKDLMEKRDLSLPPPLVMSDALPAYSAYKRKDIIDLLCLTHARRNFYDLRNVYKTETRIIIGMIKELYAIDDETKIQNMNNEDRLNYHLLYSRPVLNRLMEYCELQREMSEPNSDLTTALDYLLDNWNPITNFARVPGAMLDNNWIERLVKDIIKIRKNSLFFKTEISSKIATVVLSLIETCKVCSVNSFHYLTSVMENQAIIKETPYLFLPWNYQEILQKKASNA